MITYTPPTHLSERQQSVCIALEGFIRFCEEHQIRYFACGGTAIGAVRHQGFIPWDGDVDVYMLRADYDKFLSLYNEPLRSDKWSDYEIICPLSSGYYHSYARWAYKHSSVWERKEYPIVMGLYVDIFPLDYSPAYGEELIKSGEAVSYLWSRYRRSCLAVTKEEIKSLLSGNLFQIKNLAGRMVQKGLRSSIIRDIQRAEGEYSKHPKEEWVYNYGYSAVVKDYEVFRQEWFDDTIEMPFENLIISMPIGYHEYLMSQYGDYMALPPEEERMPLHDSYYTNYDERLSIEEIRAIKGESW